jgi:hypothetical protein
MPPSATPTGAGSDKQKKAAATADAKAKKAAAAAAKKAAATSDLIAPNPQSDPKNPGSQYIVPEFAVGDRNDIARFREILAALGLSEAENPDLLRKYQIQALFAQDDPAALKTLTASLQPDIMAAVNNRSQRDSVLANQLAAQSLILPFAQQSAGRARESAQFGSGLAQSYASFLPSALQPFAYNMAERRRNEGDQLAEAYAQQAYAAPSVQAMLASQQLASQQQQSASGGDFATALASALGK